MNIHYINTTQQSIPNIFSHTIKHFTKKHTLASSLSVKGIQER